MSRVVSVTGPPAAIWSRNSGTTEPREARTLPYRAHTNRVRGLSRQFDVQYAQPVSGVAVGNDERDGGAGSAPVPDAARKGHLVAFDGHTRPAAGAQLTPPQVAVDVCSGERQAGRAAFQDGRKLRAVRFAGGEVTEPGHRAVPYMGRRRQATPPQCLLCDLLAYVQCEGGVAVHEGDRLGARVDGEYLDLSPIGGEHGAHLLVRRRGAVHIEGGRADPVAGVDAQQLDHVAAHRLRRGMLLGGGLECIGWQGH